MDAGHSTAEEHSEVNVPMDEGDVIMELTASRPEHPALGRLHDRLVGTSSEREITSYDRMHHRHNRH
jgi:hypothetical protein